MYQILLNSYFNSEAYAKSEYGKEYQNLISFLQLHLSREDFLDLEVYLHAEIIHIVETSFIAGCMAIIKQKMEENVLLNND